jgi:hypothetical protein
MCNYPVWAVFGVKARIPYGRGLTSPWQPVRNSNFQVQGLIPRLVGLLMPFLNKVKLGIQSTIY